MHNGLFTYREVYKRLSKALLVAVMAVILLFATVNLAAGEVSEDASHWSANDSGAGTPDNAGNPHGSFSTTGNNCGICHGEHLAEGAYFMIRSDSRDDACSYCHVGGSAYSKLAVYSLSDSGIAAPNGHTIGASPVIPDSSVYQWTEDVSLTITDADGNEITETIRVRRYDSKRNKIFRFARRHGHDAPGDGPNGYLRVGPMPLGCTSCHQPHNAKDLIWRPVALEDGSRLENGYKMLRASPSGSIYGAANINGPEGDTWTESYDEGMPAWEPYIEFEPESGKVYVNASNIIRVPETTMTADNTGYGHTIYTAFEGVAESRRQGPHSDPQTVNQYALSPWCADCHNLNIGYFKQSARAELGYKSHSDRTHPVPYKGAHNGPGQCYSCHRNDMPIEPGVSYYSDEGTVCESCHFGTGSYKLVSDDLNGDGITGDSSDFPHSGTSDSIKLLGNYVGYMDADGNRQIRAGKVGKDNLDGVCKRCHTGIGSNH